MGGAPAILKRVARYCGGWMPIDVLLRDPKQWSRKCATRSAGRNPDIQLSAFCQRAAMRIP